MSTEDMWRERAESAEAKVATAQQATEQVKEKIKFLNTEFGIKPAYSGTIKIDYDKLVEGIGIEGALELRGVIDRKYSISGAPGEKPRVRLTAAADG